MHDSYGHPLARRRGFLAGFRATQGLTSPHAAPSTPRIGSAGQYSSRPSRAGARWAPRLFVFLCVSAHASHATAAGAGATLRQYLQARWRGDVQAAQALWDPDDLRRSQTLGITYPALEARFDDNLLLSAEERTALAASQPVLRDSSLETGWARFSVVVQRAAGNDTLAYHLRQSGDAWLLTSPYRKRTAGWTAREGRFFKVRSSRLRDINKDALAKLDAGTLEIMDRLHTPEIARLRLERVKLEYYLCADAAELRQLTGSTAPSQYRLAGERIVTRRLPDLNAVTRALLHLTVRETAPHAAALLEEGTPAALGGWDGNSGPVTVQRGARLAADAQTNLEAPLDAGALRGADASTAIPLAALWCQGLLQQLGPERFIALYRELSGTASQVAKLGPAEVRLALEKATGKHGKELPALVRQVPAAWRPPLAGGTPAVPEESATLKPLLNWRDREEKWALRSFVTGDDYTFVVSPYEGPIPPWMRKMIDSLRVVHGDSMPAPSNPEIRPRPAGDPPQIAVLLRPRVTSEPEAYESPLFHRHFTQRKYADDVYGLFIGPDGAQLYDYRTDTLVGARSAEHAIPEKQPYYDEKAGRITFRIRRDLLLEPLESYVAVTMIYTGE
jgi:hypothetical protein